MRIVVAKLTGLIECNIHKDDPPLFPLQSLPGWTLINPLLYLELGVNDNPFDHPFSTVALYNNSVILKTGALLFTSPLPDTEAFITLTSYLPEFLAALRLVSKQVELARIHYGGGPLLPQETTLPDLHFPDPVPNSTLYFQNLRIQAAITRKHIEQADNNILNKYFPVYSMVLLDAVHAFLDRDDRRTIIYAAMSIEIIAEKKIYEAGNPKKKGLPGESTIEKRLHRQALETLGRSLLQDNPSLYQMVEKLYRTRNKLVHVGSIPATDDFFQIDSIEARTMGKDALTALRCANDIFQWFGETDNFIPPRGFEIVQEPEGGQTLEGPSPKMLPRLFY